MKRITRVASVSAVAAVAAIGGWWARRDGETRRLPAGIVVASGRLEGTTHRVGSETGGRVVRLKVARGDRVDAGALIAELDDRKLTAAVEGAHADVAAAEAAVNAEADQVSALEARLALAETEATRYRRLFEHDAVSRQAVDRAEAEFRSLASQVDAARATRRLAARRADAARAKARLLEVDRGETVMRAPTAGVVSAVVAREGEVVAPGAPVVTLLVSEPIDLRIYLQLDVAGRLATGMEARVFVDAFPDEFFTGRVQRVASEAEFTPKDVHMPEERSTLVYAVDIRLANPDGKLKDGFPADAYVRVDPTARWPQGGPW